MALALFCVMIVASGFELCWKDGDRFDAGCFLNVYVRAPSEAEACQKALAEARSRLDEQAAAGGLIWKQPVVELEEVHRSRRFWRLVFRQGLIFFRAEEAEDAG